MTSYKKHPNYENVNELLNSMLNGENIESSNVEKLHDLLFNYKSNGKNNNHDSKRDSMVGKQIQEFTSDKPKLFDEIYSFFDCFTRKNKYLAYRLFLKNSRSSEAFLKTLFDYLKQYIEDKKQRNPNNNVPDALYKRHHNYQSAVEHINKFNDYMNNCSNRLYGLLFKYDDSKQKSMVGELILKFVSADKPEQFDEIFTNFDRDVKNDNYRICDELLKKCNNMPNPGEAFLGDLINDCLFDKYLKEYSNNTKQKNLENNNAPDVSSYKNHRNYKYVVKFINSMLKNEEIVSSNLNKLHDLLFKYDDSKQKSMVGKQILEFVPGKPEQFDEIFTDFDRDIKKGNYHKFDELLKKCNNMPNLGEAFLGDLINDCLFNNYLKNYSKNKKHKNLENNNLPDDSSYKKHRNYKDIVELINSMLKNEEIVSSDLEKLHDLLFEFDDSKQKSMVGKQILEFVPDKPELFDEIFNSFAESFRHWDLFSELESYCNKPQPGEAFLGFLISDCLCDKKLKKYFDNKKQGNLENNKVPNISSYKNHFKYKDAVKYVNEFKDYLNNCSNKLFELLFGYKKDGDNKNRNVSRNKKNSMAGMQILGSVHNELKLFDKIFSAFDESFRCLDLISELKSFCNQPAEAFLDYLFGYQQLKKIIREKRNMNRENANKTINNEEQKQKFIEKQKQKAIKFIISQIKSVAENSELAKSVFVSEKKMDELFKILFKGESNSLLGSEFQTKAKICVSTAHKLLTNFNNKTNKDDNTNIIESELFNEAIESFNEDIEVAYNGSFNEEVEGVVLYLCSSYYSFYLDNHSAMNTFLKCICSNLNDANSTAEKFVNFLLDDFLKSIPKTSISSILEELYGIHYHSAGKKTHVSVDEDKYNDFMNNLPARVEQVESLDRFDIIRNVLIRITDCMSEEIKAGEAKAKKANSKKANSKKANSKKANSKKANAEKPKWEKDDYKFTAGLQMYPHLKNCKDFNLTTDQVDLCNELCEWIESTVKDIDLLKKEHDYSNEILEGIRYKRYIGKSKGSLLNSYRNLLCNPLKARQLVNFYTDPNYTTTPMIYKNPLKTCRAKRSRYASKFLEFRVLDTILGSLVDDERQIISEVLNGFKFNKDKTDWHTDYYFIIGLQMYPYLEKCAEYVSTREQMKRCLALKQFVVDKLKEYRQSRNDIFVVADLDGEYILIRNDINQQIKQKEDDICLSEKNFEEFKSEKENLNKATPKYNEKIKNLTLDIKFNKEKLKKLPQDIKVLKKRLLIAPFNDAKQVESFCNVNFELAERMIYDYLEFLRSIYSKIKEKPNQRNGGE